MVLDTYMGFKYEIGNRVNNPNWELYVVDRRWKKVGPDLYTVEYMVDDGTYLDFWGTAMEIENI